MDKIELTPEQSLLLITKTIDETKERLKAHGGILIFWGTLIVVVFGLQYLLWYLDLNEYMIHTSYLFSIGAIYTGIHMWKEKKKRNMPKTILSNVLNIGWIIGMNLMLMGIFFSDKLGEAAAPIFVILFALMITVIGLSIRFKPLTIGGILTNLVGLGTFYVNGDYHGLSLIIAAIIGMIIPGLLLNLNRKKKMFKDLDPILHSQLRLSIVSILMSVEEANFNFIKEETQATSGNLSVQFKKLQDAGYIKVKKTFKNNYPNTSVSITKKGIEAFENYVNNLKNTSILNSFIHWIYDLYFSIYFVNNIKKIRGTINVEPNSISLK